MDYVCDRPDMPLAAWFVEEMAKGQTMTSQGAVRRRFFDNVVQKAKAVSSVFESYLIRR